jgi:hypothetical protein
LTLIESRMSGYVMNDSHARPYGNLASAPPPFLHDSSPAGPSPPTSTRLPATVANNLLNVDEVIPLFAGCTRLRSLHITGGINIIYYLLDAHTATHFRPEATYILRINGPLFNSLMICWGVSQPIREMCFLSVGYIIVL